MRGAAQGRLLLLLQFLQPQLQTAQTRGKLLQTIAALRNTQQAQQCEAIEVRKTATA